MNPKVAAASLLDDDRSPSAKFTLLLSSLLLHVLSLTLPLTMMQVYDRILLNQSYSTLSWLVTACVIAIFMESGLRYLRTRLGHLLAARFEHLSSKKILKHMLKARLDAFEKEPPSVHIERFQSIQTLKNFYSGQLYQVLLDLPFGILFLVVIFHLGGWVVAVPLLAGVVYIALVFYCRFRFDIKNATEVESKQERQGFLMQLLNSLSTVKGLNMEEQMLRRYERLQFKKVVSQSDSNAWAELPGLLGPTFSQITMFGTILFCSQLVVSGDMTMGGLTACMMLSSRALQPLQQSATFWIKLPAVRQAKEQIGIIQEIPQEVDLSTEEELAAQPKDLEGEIVIKDLSFKYGEEAPWVLDHINLNVPAQKMIGLTGPSKNGSTTLLLLMMGLLQADEEKIYIDQFPIESLHDQSLQGKIQYLPRNGILFKGSILDNLTSFKPHLQSIALDVASMLGLDPLIAGLPHGYETSVDSRSKISKEIVHRISLARVLITRPRILLVDKSTASMDGRSEKVFLELLEKLRPMCTIVIVSQWPYLLGLCDQVYELKDGQLNKATRKHARGKAIT